MMVTLQNDQITTSAAKVRVENDVGTVPSSSAASSRDASQPSLAETQHDENHSQSSDGVRSGFVVQKNIFFFFSRDF